MPDGEKTYRCGTLTYTTRGLVLLFAWMLWGDFCFSLMESVVPSVLPLKLQNLHSNNALIGFIMTTLPAVFNLTITPAVSFKSDRHRGRWGRRLPFILATMPFLTLSLLLIGFSDPLGKWLYGRFFAGGAAGETQVVIVLLAVFAALFDLFNMFVNTVYWYLFNDVVPHEWMGRFMGWFRVVGTLSTMLYNFFIFQFALSHMQFIFLGAALLYFFGFGLMCLRVKEGEYPKPEGEGPPPGFLEGLARDVRLFARECFTSRYYWYIFLTYSFSVFAGCISVFGIFGARSMGLSLDQIGKMAAIGAFTTPICFLFAGAFVDRWHSVRVAAYIAAFGVFCTESGGWIWLLVDKPSPLLFFWLSATAGTLFAPVGALNDTAGMTRLMMLLPLDRFGEFSGAMCLVRAVAIILGGVSAGAFIDHFGRHFFPSGDFVYRLNFLWFAPFSAIAFYFHYKTYRVWKRLGGKAYAAPSADFQVSTLRPYPGDDGRVNRSILWVIGVSFAGSQVAGPVWIWYYLFQERNTHYAAWFAISSVINCSLFLVYLRFIKFMERP